MAPRYLVVVGPREQSATIEARAARFAGRHALARAHAADGIAVFAEAGEVQPFGTGALVLGSLFCRNGAPTTAAEPAERRLVRDHWGSYLAVMPDPASQTTRFLRAPFGELGCYYCSDGALTLVASDVEMLCAWTRANPPLDWQAVARHLLFSDIREPDTCLAGIRELPGGMCLRVRHDRTTTETLWSPWDFVAPHELDLEACAEGLRAVVVECVGRVGRSFDRVLLGLSGGLDSSVVAAALGTAGAAFKCLTLVSADALGDERVFARATVEALGVSLIEAPRLLAGIDLTRSGAAHLPRPVARAFAQESERNLLGAARTAGATAILRGGGGDNVFCYLQSVRPVVDRLRSDGIPAALATATDVARLTGCGLPTALRRTLRQLARSPGYRFAPNPSLLAPELVVGAPDVARHPWLEPPSGTLPGKAAHIALILAMSNHMEPLAPDIAMPLLSPLMSQPIVEFCLGVPSWLWCRGGHNRVVARRAFADLLPPAVIERRGKGAPDSFVIEIYDANRALLRDFLEGGLLAGQGIIDLAGLRAVLAAPGPVRGNAHARVMQLADVEAWARSWAGRRLSR